MYIISLIKQYCITGSQKFALNYDNDQPIKKHHDVFRALFRHLILNF